MFWIIIIALPLLAAWGMRKDGKVIGVRGKSIPVRDPSEMFLTEKEEKKRQAKNFLEGATGVFFWIALPVLLVWIFGR